MTKAQTLLKMIKEEVLADIEDVMDEIFTVIADKKATDEDKAELEELRELKENFESLVKEIENDELDDEECDDLISEIRSMKQDS